MDRYLKFTVTYEADGKKQTQTMSYSTADIVKTLERRLKTAFPGASNIAITEAK